MTQQILESSDGTQSGDATRNALIRQTAISPISSVRSRRSLA